MDKMLALVSCAIISFYGMSQTEAYTFGLTGNKISPKADDIMDIPSGLIIGAGISSHQHEGARNIGDKVESYVEHLYPNNQTTNFYYKYKEDIELLKDIGFESFRLSISWSRLLPNITSDYVSEDGLRFYNNVLDELEKRGIKPFVTIYHWDHPQKLEDEGGWLNERMIDLYANYSRVVFEHFGNRVKYFGTINEPRLFCGFISPPGIPNEIARYKCHQNMMKAHALAYHIYDKEFRHLQNGEIGIIEVCDAYYPYSKDEKDVKALKVAHEFECGLTLHPIFSEEGDYPEIMKIKVAERSKLQGYNESRLPELSKEWIDKLKNSSDFFGLNHYSSMVTKQLTGNPLSWPNDEGIEYSKDPTWLQTPTNPFYVVPEGLGDLLRLIRDKYNNVPVYILENGVPLIKNTNDDFRINFFHAYLKEMLIAIKRDKCDVRMFSLWSFLDGFESVAYPDYSYGIVQVDFNDSDRKRTPKKSASWFKALLKSRKLLPPGIRLPKMNVHRKSAVLPKNVAYDGRVKASVGHQH